MSNDVEGGRRHHAEPPSGRQHRLVYGDQEVVVTEVGATLRSYLVGGQPVLDGFAPTDFCSVGRGQLLIPWPNRMGDGRYSFDGQEHQVALDEPDLGNALHGLTRWASWTAETASDTVLLMRYRLHARGGYPFSLDLSATFELGTAGLTVSVSATNIGAARAPFGSGAHPYLRVGTPLIDKCTLRVPAATHLLTDSRMLPTGRSAVEGSPFDFRVPRQIGGTRLDTAYTDLDRDPDGRARVSLESPQGRRVSLWFDEAHPWVVIFTGDPLPASERRRGLAVEPMTCPPDAFRSGEDLIVLDPGATTVARWGIDVRGFRG